MTFMWLKKSALLNTLLTLCICTYCLYQVQELALENADSINKNHLRPPPILSPLHMDRNIKETHPDLLAVEELNSHERSKPDLHHQAPSNTTVWITMALCWSGNTQYHGKSKFPYKEAVIYSSQLWLKLTKAKVMLQVVYSEAEVSKELLEYKAQLEGYGVVVKLVPTGTYECVLTAELIRLLAFQLDEIEMDNIVVTADVDAFIMTPNILKPLKLWWKKFWIYRYELTLGTGYTFMMPFIGARAKTWKETLFLNQNNITLEWLVSHYGEKMNFRKDYTWDIDQHIVSHSILDSGLCSVPNDNSLWAEVKLKPKASDDSMTCWHGRSFYEDCNNKLWSRNIMIRYLGGNCKWWHFYPDEKVKNLKEKFEEIINGESETGIVTNIVGNARKWQKQVFGSSLM